VQTRKREREKGTKLLIMNILRDMQPHFAFEVSTLSAVEQKYAR